MIAEDDVLGCTWLDVRAGPNVIAPKRLEVNIKANSKHKLAKVPATAGSINEIFKKVSV